MGEQLKLIVQALNKEPFNKNLNLISFDSLEPLSLLQILTDVLGQIDPKHKLDIRQETPDQTAIRIVNTLKILKYRPPAERESQSDFTCGLVQADKPVIYPILEWLLNGLPELKKRAYLAQFLVKINIPPEIIQEDLVVESYEQYEELIKQFKEWHKHSEQLKTSSFNTPEIRRDISQMEEEKEQLLKRIERLKRKVESHPNAETMMRAAKNLRQERDHEKKLAEQKTKQNEQIHQAEQRIWRLQQQLKNTQQSRDGASTKVLLQRMEEETKTNQYLVKIQQNELEEKNKTSEDMQKVVSEPLLGQTEINELENKMHAVSKEVNQLIEKKSLHADGVDDKLRLFSNQATIVSHKKKEKVEELQRMREEMNKLSQMLEERRQVVKESGTGEILRGEDYMRFVNKLRAKSNSHKKKKLELEEMRAEHGVLSRTEEILSSRLGLVDQQLSALETDQGVAGYRETQEQLEKVSAIKSEFDEMKDKTLEDMSKMVSMLNKKIEDKKGALTPIIEKLRLLREEFKTINEEYEKKKSTYEMQSANLETQRSQLEKEVRSYREECNHQESRYHYLNIQNEVLENQKQRIQEEMNAYISADPQVKKKTLREMYLKNIKEQEILGKNLREEMKFLQDNQAPRLKQMEQWKDFMRIMECKKKCFDLMYNAETGDKALHLGNAPAFHEEDRLIL